MLRSEAVEVSLLLPLDFPIEPFGDLYVISCFSSRAIKSNNSGLCSTVFHESSAKVIISLSIKSLSTTYLLLIKSAVSWFVFKDNDDWFRLRVGSTSGKREILL